MIVLTESEAFEAMILFLQQYNERNKPDDTKLVIQGLLNIQPNNQSIRIGHPDWQTIIKSLYPMTIDPNSIKEYTEQQAFEAMIKLLETYYDRTNSDDIGSLLGDLLHSHYGSTSDPAAWSDWEKCLQKVVSERQSADKQ